MKRGSAQPDLVVWGLLSRWFERLKSSFMKRTDRLVRRLPRKRPVQETLSPFRKASVLFIGYAESALGLGESFRNLLTALDDAGASFSIYPFNRNVETRHIGPFLERRYDTLGTYDINVAYLAPDQLPACFEEVGPKLGASGYTILRTFWELPRAPDAWARSLEKIDELWVPSAFVANAFRPVFKGTITTIPECIRVPRAHGWSRSAFGLAEKRFYFLFSFDYYSGTVRKNPLGAALAFAYAFPDPETNVGLFIKTTGPGELDPATFRALRNFAEIDKRIVIVDRSAPREEMLALLDSCDCYLSLHRSEGFGLGMAEALALRKPVIGTDFSGNCDFLTEETGFPVPYTLRPLTPGEYPMGQGQSWAEPDLAAAIDRMRLVFGDREGPRIRAARGAEFIARRYSSEVVAKIVETRLRDIRMARGFREPI